MNGYALSREEAVVLAEKLWNATGLKAQPVKYTWPDDSWFILVMDSHNIVIDCVDTEVLVDALIEVYRGKNA